MVAPVPGYGVSTPYGITGSNWTGCGFHTGADIAAPHGAAVAACIAGTIRHRNYGSAFGGWQFVISPSSGQPYPADEAFYAHCLSRLPDGTEVEVGQRVSEVGSEGNATGPHLHLEWHRGVKGDWVCSSMADPQPLIEHSASSVDEADPWGSGDVYVDRLFPGSTDSDSVRRLQCCLNGVALVGGSTLPVTGNYLDLTEAEVALFQEQVCGDPGDGAIGSKQAARLFPQPPYRLL